MKTLIAESKNLNKTVECWFKITEDGYLISQYKVQEIQHPATKRMVPCVTVKTTELNKLWKTKLTGDIITVPLRDVDEYRKLVNEAKDARKAFLTAEKAENDRIMTEKRKSFFEKARITGQRQLIEKCPVDKMPAISAEYRGQWVKVYANPDGTTTSEYEKSEPLNF